MANEKRLIDANRALEVVYEHGIAHPNVYYLTNYAMAILQEAPTVDAVEVVRCRECKYHNKPTCHISRSFNWTDDNDFCSYGERKDGAGNG